MAKSVWDDIVGFVTGNKKFKKSGGIYGKNDRENEETPEDNPKYFEGSDSKEKEKEPEKTSMLTDEQDSEDNQPKLSKVMKPKKYTRA